MTIYEQAFETYRAIYGSSSTPAYHPYYEASHTPFKGMDVNLVKSLVNETEVNAYLRQWRKENAKTKGDFSHDYKDQIQYITWKGRKLVLLPFQTENISRDNPLVYIMYDILNYKDTYHSQYITRHFLEETALRDSRSFKYRLPLPGEADKVQDLLQFKSPVIAQKVQAEGTYDNLGYTNNDSTYSIAEILAYKANGRLARVKYYIPNTSKIYFNTETVLIGQIHDL